MARKLAVEIEYCVVWDYLPQAVSLTESLLEEFAEDIESWTLRPSGGGRFEVSINGELVFSKKKLGRHPKKTEIADLIRARLGSA